MLSLFPPLFSAVGWSVEDPTNHDQNYAETSESLFHHHHQVTPSSHQPQLDHNRCTPSTSISGDPTVVKKLNHNASERDRRKKINTLFSSLRSLLPATDQTKKLSIPATVSRVLKYIPELQRQVEGLIQKKEELLSKFSRQGDLNHHQQTQIKSAARSSVTAVSASQLNDREVIIQITTDKVHNCSLSDILLFLEKDGLLLLNASSSESFGGRVFCNLHLQLTQLSQQMTAQQQQLKEKLMQQLTQSSGKNR